MNIMLLSAEITNRSFLLTVADVTIVWHVLFEVEALL